MIILLRNIVIATLLVLLVALTGIVLTEQSLYHTIAMWSAWLYLGSGILFLLVTGNFVRSSQYRFSKIGISVFILGVLFKIMHWPYSLIMIGAGMLIVLIAYGWYMLQNATPGLKNILTFFFVFVLFLNQCFKMMHWPYQGEINLVMFALLTVLLANRIRAIRVKG